MDRMLSENLKMDKMEPLEVALFYQEAFKLVSYIVTRYRMYRVKENPSEIQGGETRGASDRGSARDLNRTIGERMARYDLKIMKLSEVSGEMPFCYRYRLTDPILQASIHSHGVLMPVVVSNDQRPVVISGHKRFYAARTLKKKEILRSWR